jgi:cellulose synthase/poly-beta-1,6-N-acetylglucosamine synthase-like glycosyltransferase
MARTPWLSIVIPVFNEAESLEPLWTELRLALEALGRSYEVIFVDDGSEDGSTEILRRLRGRHSEVRLITTRKTSPPSWITSRPGTRSVGGGSDAKTPGSVASRPISPTACGTP